MPYHFDCYLQTQVAAEKLSWKHAPQPTQEVQDAEPAAEATGTLGRVLGRG